MQDLLKDRVISAIGGDYDVGAELGRGGMSVVYRALDLRLMRQVAIKVLPPEFAYDRGVRERFRREASTAAQLNHPHIVPIFSVDEREGIVFFVMSVCDGESLAVRLARTKRPPLPEVRRVLAEVADALHYAHAKGVVHRDIKPDNILIERESGRTLVTDFGIARAAEGGSRLTVTGIAMGTPAYMSPEQALGEQEFDGRSDIYSLGIVGYQMITGATPFSAGNAPSMLLKHVSEEPIPIRERRADVPEALAQVIERSLRKKPGMRWQSAGDMYEALNAEGALERDQSSGRSGGDTRPPSRSACVAARHPCQRRQAGRRPAGRNSRARVVRIVAPRPVQTGPQANRQIEEGGHCQCVAGTDFPLHAVRVSGSTSR
jgi:serine/threonine-protein kinase